MSCTYVQPAPPRRPRSHLRVCLVNSARCAGQIIHSSNTLDKTLCSIVFDCDTEQCSAHATHRHMTDTVAHPTRSTQSLKDNTPPHAALLDLLQTVHCCAHLSSLAASLAAPSPLPTPATGILHSSTHLPGYRA